MDSLEAVLRNWDACDPDGVLLSATHLGRVIKLVTQQLQEPSLPAAARADAAGLLNVAGSGQPPLLRLLHVSGSRTSCEAIHFFRFWQTFEEVARRLGGADEIMLRPSCAPQKEPLAEEILEFRDGLLRRLDHTSVTQAMDGFVAQATLYADIARMREMSGDSAAWAMLEAALGDGASEPTDQFQLHVVFEVVLSWLRTLCEDYIRGQRATRISCLLDAAQCGRRQACLHLGIAGWDVETALQRFFAGQATQGSIVPAGTSWSTQGAKLRKEEIECPICMHPYAGHHVAASVGAPVQLSCCFQVLCRSCYKKLVNEQHMISCPFCRVVDHVAPEVLTSDPGTRRRSSSLGKICQTADRLATGARRALRTRDSNRGRQASRTRRRHDQFAGMWGAVW